MKSIEVIPGTEKDEVLLNAYRSSPNQELLARLYLKYTDLVYGTALKYLKDPEAAKDAVMDICQQLVEKLQKHEVQNFKSWLYMVTKNHCLMEIRRNKNLKTVSLEPSVMQFDEKLHPGYDIGKESDLTRLEICIENLHSDQKDAVRMFYLQNKCYKEISTITDLDWNKVRSLIQNGRRNLKNCMEKNA